MFKEKRVAKKEVAGAGAGNSVSRQVEGEHFRLIVENSRDMIFTLNLKGEFIFVSPSSKEILGYDPAELQGLPFQSIVHPDDISACEEAIRKNIEKGERTPGFEYRVKDRSGNWRWHISSGSAVLAADGSFLHLLGVAKDITERKKVEAALRASEHKYRTLIDTLQEGVWAIDKEGLTTYANACMAQMLGYTPDEMMGRPLFSFMSESQVTVARANMERRAQGIKEQHDFEFLKKDGSRIYTMLEAGPMTDEEGNYIGAIAGVTDITERRKMEAALKESENRVKAKLDAIISPVGDIGKLELADIVDTQAIQLLMDDFYKLTNIGMAIIDLKGKVLVATGWQDICTQFHRIHPETCKNCVESDTLLSQEVEEGTYKIYKCKNNMWDMVTPIYVGSKQVGNLFLGQFLFADEAPDYDIFRSQARRYGFNEVDYFAALERVPRWNEVTVDTVMAFYTKFAHLISSLS
jgi:PAS domain S-box-containing protein